MKARRQICSRRAFFRFAGEDAWPSNQKSRRGKLVRLSQPRMLPASPAGTSASKRGDRMLGSRNKEIAKPGI